MKMYMTNKPNGEPFYPVTVAEAVLVSEGETLAAVLQRLEQRIAELEKSEAAPQAQTTERATEDAVMDFQNG